MKIKTHATEIEIVTFMSTTDEGEAYGKRRLTELVNQGFEIVTAAGSGDGSRSGDGSLAIVTVILQRKVPVS